LKSDFTVHTCFVYYIGGVYDSDRGNKVIWLRSSVEDLGLHQGVTMVFCDIQSAIYVTKHQTYQERTKHIGVRYYFHSKNVTKVKKIGITDNPIDMMIKFVSLCKFEHCLKLLGVQSGGG